MPSVRRSARGVSCLRSGMNEAMATAAAEMRPNEKLEPRLDATEEGRAPGLKGGPLAAFAMAALYLIGCAGPINKSTAPIQPQQNRYRIVNQPQDVVYVPVLRFRRDGSSAPIREGSAALINVTLSYALSLDACKSALAKAAQRPQAGQFAGYRPSEKLCVEVRRSGEQKPITVS